ncbi:MAG: hypothetical protein ACOX5G_10490 [Kiritimatiellia bacterium]
MQLKIGDFTLDVLSDAAGAFSGIGAVSCGKTLLRSDKLPWILHAEADEGFRFDTFRKLRRKALRGGGVALSFESEGAWMPRLPSADAMGDSRMQTRRIKAPVARFTWTFRPVSETIAGNAWTGIAMRVSVESPDAPIHWILEDATWEIGGRATGATLVQQDVSTIGLEQAVTKGSAFSTIEKFFTEGWGGSFPMDMLPRAAGAAICDFQVKGATALCLFAEKPDLTRARLEKFADEDVIHYMDRPFVDKAAKVSFPERKLLVHQAPAKLKRHQWRNLWLDCFCEVRDRILANYGFRYEVPEPCVHAHLWDAELKERGPAWVEPLKQAFPDYAALGYKHVFTHGVWDSVTSDDNPAVHGNICCPYSYTYAEKFGGAANMKTVGDAAKAAGLRVFQWYSFQLSSFAPIWKQHPEWLLREQGGDPWDGAYGTLWSARFRSPYGRKLEKEMLAVKRQTGIDCAFWDSYQNLGVTCVDWQGKDKNPQAADIWRFQGRLQKAGFLQRCEVVTIFGVSQVAMFGFQDDAFRRRLWSDAVEGDWAFAMLDCSPAFFTDGPCFAADKLSPEHYFWLAGHRVLPGAGARPWDTKRNPAFLPGGELADAYARINHAYNALLPRMRRLRLVEGGKYTLWLDAKNRPAAIWAFQDASCEWTGDVNDVTGSLTVRSDGVFPLKAGHAYALLPPTRKARKR